MLPLPVELLLVLTEILSLKPKSPKTTSDLEFKKIFLLTKEKNLKICNKFNFKDKNYAGLISLCTILHL